MTAPPVSPPPVKKHRLRRVFGWTAGLTLCLLLAAVVTRAVLIREMRWPRLTIAEKGDVMAVAVTPDGKAIFAGDEPHYSPLRSYSNESADVKVWNAADGHLVRDLPAFYWRASGVSISPTGRQVMASSYTQRDIPGMPRSRVIAWDWQTGEKQWNVEGDLPLSFSPDGHLAGCANGIYDATTGTLVCRTSKSIEEGGQSEFAPAGRLFGIIDAANNKPGAVRDPGFEKTLYSTTRLRFWHTDTGKEAKDFPFTRVRAFDIARSGQWLIMTSDADGMTGGTDGSVVRRVDFNTGKAIWTRERRENGPDADPESVLNSVAVSLNGKYVVLLSINSHLIVLDAQTGRELFRPFIPPGTTVPSWALPGGLAFSADGKTLVSRCGRRVLVWDATALQ